MKYTFFFCATQVERGGYGVRSPMQILNYANSDANTRTHTDTGFIWA